MFEAISKQEIELEILGFVQWLEDQPQGVQQRHLKRMGLEGRPLEVLRQDLEYRTESQ